MVKRALGLVVAVAVMCFWSAAGIANGATPVPPVNAVKPVPAWWTASPAVQPTHIEYHDFANNPMNLLNGGASGGDYDYRNWPDADPAYNFSYTYVPTFGVSGFSSGNPDPTWGDNVGMLLPAQQSLIKTMDNVAINSFNKEIYIAVVWHSETEPGTGLNALQLQIFVPGPQGPVQAYLSPGFPGLIDGVDHFELQAWSGVLVDARGVPIPQPAWEQFVFFNPNNAGAGGQGIYLIRSGSARTAPNPPRWRSLPPVGSSVVLSVDG